MRGLAIALIASGVLFVPLALPSATVAGAAPVTASETVSRFRQLTGDRLVVNRPRSLAGRYLALDLGPASAFDRARYGTFTVYVVTAPDVERQVEDLLVDGHSGVLGTPGSGNIHWEAGVTLHGERYWLGKRRYGANIVLWWFSSARKTDAAFRRLHGPLTAITRR